MIVSKSNQIQLGLFAQSVRTFLPPTGNNLTHPKATSFASAFLFGAAQTAKQFQSNMSLA